MHCGTGQFYCPAHAVCAELYSEATPSFALMDVQGPVIVTYVYQLVDGEASHLCCPSPHY